MFRKILYRLLHPRHFWRDVGFDELSEIYMSMIIRSLAISLTGLFIPVYMLRLGYDVTAVSWLAAWYFLIRAFGGDVAAAYMTARVGPKHTIVAGNVLLITSTALFLTQPHMHWSVPLLGAVWGASASFFFIPFHVDFSKVKHKKHGGKELGYLNIMEKLGFALGPIAGGVIATIFGAQYIFLLASILLILGLVPLFRSGEPVRARQHLDWHGIDVAKLRRDFISYGALGIENTFSVFLWPMYLGLFVLVSSTAYLKLGAISTLSVSASILTAFTIGKLIDRHKGRDLLRVATVANAGVHLIRPFVRSYPVATATTLANDGVTIAYRMPYLKGMYDAADDLPGYRIVYITSMEWFGSALKALAWLTLVMLSSVMTDRHVVTVGFVIAAVSSLIIATERFRALNH